MIPIASGPGNSNLFLLFYVGSMDQFTDLHLDLNHLLLFRIPLLQDTFFAKIYILMIRYDYILNQEPFIDLIYCFSAALEFMFPIIPKW